MNWKEIAEAKRKAILDKIPKEWIIDVPADDSLNTVEYLDSILPIEEISITNQSMTALCEQISSGQLTSVEVVTAFCHRAALSHQILNNCSEIFFDRAISRARDLDRIYKETGTTVGKLHGIPISLKDQINLPGLDSAIGYISRLNNPKTKDDESLIAQILHDAGAVFYIKTTTPMAMSAVDTFSNIYGETFNSFNKKLSCGGSSGGEGSIIGSKAGLIGLSTDIGGSIRIPALFQGLFAIRPSSNRLPYCKVENSMPFQPIIPSVIGPSARNLDDLKTLFKLIIDAEPWLRDPKVPPIAWRDVQLPKKLAFAVMRDNKARHVHPPISRAIEYIVEKLTQAGHEVVEWNPPIDPITMRDNLSKILTADGYKEILDETKKSGEPIIPQLIPQPDKIPAPVTVTEHWEQAGLKYQHQQQYDAYWRSVPTSTGRPVDAIICPGWESTSYLAGDPQVDASGYTNLSNYLDYSTVVVPITFADKLVDRPYKDFQCYNAEDERINDSYDPELFDGMPVAVQVVGRRYEEEKLLELAGLVHELTH